MEENQLIRMERTGKIIRRSIHRFLQDYEYFTCTAAVIALPFSVIALLSQSAIPSSSPLLPIIHSRLHSLFVGAGFPPSSHFFSFLNMKLCQTISSSICTLPLTLSFLLLAKASVIQIFHPRKPSSPPFRSFLLLYNPLLITHLCSSLFILSANAVAFSILFIAFNSLSTFDFSSPNLLLFLSAAGAVLYSIILANALIICNLAMAVAGMENCGGYLAILKACVLIRGRTLTALSLALPVNLSLAAIDALFRSRMLRAYHPSSVPTTSMALEGLLIAYLYSLIIVLDTITSCIFYKSCRLDSQINQEGRYHSQIDIAEEENRTTKLKSLQEFP